MRECETAVPNGERYNLFPLTKHIDTRGMNSKENKERCQGISPEAFQEQTEPLSPIEPPPANLQEKTAPVRLAEGGNPMIG